MLVITNAADHSVSNAMTGRVVALWQARGTNIATYEFPGHLGLNHDVVDPHRPDQQIDLVYPILMDLFEKYK